MRRSPGNIIPTIAHLADCAQAAAVLPGDQPAGPGQQLLRAGADHGPYDQTLDRIDQNIGDKIRLYVRAHYQNWPAFGGSAIPVNGEHDAHHHDNYTVGYTHTLTANLVNDLRVGRNFFNYRDSQSLLCQQPDHRRHEPGDPGL